jgi:hypothetical protein
MSSFFQNVAENFFDLFCQKSDLVDFFSGQFQAHILLSNLKELKWEQLNTQSKAHIESSQFKNIPD